MTHKYFGFMDGPRVGMVSMVSAIIYKQIVGVPVTKTTKQDNNKKIQKGTVGAQQERKGEVSESPLGDLLVFFKY
jgi:hypothetical protein